MSKQFSDFNNTDEAADLAFFRKGFYKSFYENIPEMFFVGNYKGKIVDCNQYMTDLLGYTKEELLALPSWRNLFTRESRELAERIYPLYEGNGFARNIEVQVVRKDGEKIDVSSSAVTVKDTNGKVAYHFAVWHEISELVKIRAELQDANLRLHELAESLREAQIFYEDFYENAPDMFLSIDCGLDGAMRINRCNRTLCVKLGYTTEELVNINLDDIYYPACLQRVKKIREILLKQGSIQDAEMMLRKKNGELLYVSLNAVAVKNEQGKVIKIRETWRDVEDLVMTRKELEQTNISMSKRNQELDTFSHIIAHDLKAPLRAINFFTGELQKDKANILSDGSIKALSFLSEHIRSMDRLLSDIFTYFFKCESAGSYETFEWGKFFEDICVSLSIPSGFVIEREPLNTVLTTQKILLQQVIINLMNNAIKHHHDPEHGKIEVILQEKSDSYAFSIRDNGPGIPSEFLQDIFKPLHHFNRTGRSEGTGLGLAIVEKIISQQGGSIMVESQEGKGSVFSFMWPRSLDKS